jgi:hypothetical protein
MSDFICLYLVSFNAIFPSIMKRQIFFVLLIMPLFIAACENKEQVKQKIKCGEIIDIPPGLSDSASAYLRRKEGDSSSVSSIVVRVYPNEKPYLVTIEEKYTPPTNSNGNINAKPAVTIKTVNYIAQRIKGSSDRWQFQEATPEAIQLYGMKCE